MGKAMVSPVLVIGVGNEYRSDDRVGLMVLRSLETNRVPGVIYLESNGDGMALMEAWSHASKVILIDAISSGMPPGTIYRFDALAQALPTSCSFQSTHAFGVAEAIKMAQTLGQLPAALIVYGIGGGDFRAGTELSPEVCAAMHKVIGQIMQELHEATMP